MGAFLLCLIAPYASAQMPPAGTTVANRAYADYLDGVTLERSFSNVVSTLVLPVYVIGLSPPGTVASPAFSLTGAGGDTVYCAFDITNTGNDRDSVAVSYGVVPPSNATVGDMIFFDDANGNGRLDSGEDDPAFLALDAGATQRMDAAVVLPAGSFGGNAFVEVRAQSTTSPAPSVETSVVHVFNTDPPLTTLYLGPRGNPRALPGGEDSGDDLTVGLVDYAAASFTFENDVLNVGVGPDFYEIALADSVALPSGIQVSFADSTGQQLPQSPSRSTAYLFGMVDAGQTRPLQVRVSSVAGPLSDVLDGPLSLRIRARSSIDTLQLNHTIDRLMPPQQINPDATLSIDQAFREQVASVGDVVTMLVTARNITDDLRVDSVVVDEWVQPQLDFVSSPDFEWENGRLVWRAGALDGSQAKTTVVKFVANSRVTSGTAKAIGNVSGVAESGDPVFAGPAVSVIRLENDVFATEGVVLGEVYVDENDNRRRDRGESGVPDVAVFLDSGEYAVTDSLGRCSLPRVFSGWRMVRLDEGDIPAGLEFFEPLDGREGGRRPNERLIHLVPSGNADVSFRLRRVEPPMASVDHVVSYQERISISKFARLYQAFVFPSSHFAMGKATLTIDSVEEHRPVVEFLYEHPDWDLLVEGHTDSIPIHTEEFPSNYELSVARADAVRKYFESMGIERSRITVRGHGESWPIATNETVEGRRLNRRVEVSFIPPGVKPDDGELRRTSATVRDMSALPDTFKVKISWQLATTSERPGNATFRVDVPHRFQPADVQVTLNGNVANPVDGEYRLADFARSRAVACEINFRAAESDTAHLRDIEAMLEIDDPSAPVGPGPASGIGEGGVAFHGETASTQVVRTARRSFVIRPGGGGILGSDAVDPRVTELLKWSETVPASVVETSPDGAPGDTATDVQKKVRSNSRGGGRPGDVNDPRGPADPTLQNGASRGAAPGGADNRKFAIVEPLPGEVFTRADQIKVRVRVPLGGKTVVFVGGEQLPDRHIGRKAVHVNEGFEEITWYAVRIRPGWNTIELKTTTPDGNAHSDSVSVARAARPASVAAERKRILVPADGRSSDVIRFQVRDELGLPVADGFTATVTEGDSIVVGPDARPDSPGLQVTSRSGYFCLRIAPSNETGRRLITIDCSGMRASCDVAYVSAVRPMMATGVVDFRLGAYETSGDGSPAGLDNYEDGASADVEARLFMQSALPHGFGLTARLDSEQRDEDPLLKQINPNAQYPIYGDASELHFAAPSRTGNYVSLDKGESFLRYGDFRTPFTNGRYLYYHEVATGVTGALVGRDGAVRAFVTDTDYATHRDEIEADGTSGFYYFSRSPVIENSEQLFLETRDRFQSEIVLELKPLVRNRDYNINYFDGSVLFQEPVPAFDRYLNPVYIVAIYEVRTGEDSQYLYGLRGDLVRDRRYNVGATAVTNSGDGQQYALYGMDGGIDISGVTVGGEFARSEDEVTGDGNAFRLEAGVNNRLTDTRVYYQNVDRDFENPSFLGGTQELGTRKAGIKSRLFLWEGMSLYGDGFVHDRRIIDRENTSLLAGADYRNRFFRFFAGGRHAAETDVDGDRTGILSVFKFQADVKRRLEFSTWWEHNLGDEWVAEFPDRLQTLLAVPFGERLRLSATHEYLTAPGRPGTNQFLAGVESRVAPRTTVYTRYTMNRTATDERMGAVAGLRQTFSLRHNVTATAALEGYRSMADRPEDEYLAVKTGLATRKDNAHVFETRYEYRWQPTRGKHLVQLIASAQLTSGFSLLLNDVFSSAPDEEREDGLNYRGKLGLVYRPIGLPVQTLFAMKNFYDRYTPVNPDAISWRLVLSADANVLAAADHELRFKYAHKRAESYSYGISVNTDTDLVLGQYVYRFAQPWDVDVWGRLLSQRGGTVETGAGVEVGRLFFRSVRVAAGYSFGGFEDPDISGTDAWARGFGLRVQLILSDWVLQQFGGM